MQETFSQVIFFFQVVVWGCKVKQLDYILFHPVLVL